MIENIVIRNVESKYLSIVKSTSSIIHPIIIITLIILDMLIVFDKFFFEKGIKNMLKILFKIDGWDWNSEGWDGNMVNSEGWEV